MTAPVSIIGADLIGVPEGWGRGGWVLWLGDFGRGVSLFLCGKNLCVGGGSL